MEDILAGTNISNAYLVLSGRTVSNSLPLFNTPKLENLLKALAKSFDIVLVDAPPVGAIIDAAKIAAVCDGTLFVVQSGEAGAQELANATAQIEKAGCSVVGFVLNKYDARRFGGKYYYRTYGTNFAAGTRKRKKGGFLKW